MRTGHNDLGNSQQSDWPPSIRRNHRRACYGFRLSPLPARTTQRKSSPLPVSNRKGEFCLEHFSGKVFFLLLLSIFPSISRPQAVTHPLKADLPPVDEIWYSGLIQDDRSEWKYLKNSAKVQTSDMVITADEIDFNSDTDWAYARGHVRMQHFATGDIINAGHAEYNIRTEEGKFYDVDGTAPAKIMTSPGSITTTNPFYFQAAWADRIKNRYVLHKGFVTDCKVPRPWWVFESPIFDIVPGDRAIARRAIFKLHRVPILYLPYFYRPLGRNPRQSGFLTPNLGHSSIRGYMVGGGYYWAINRSYDVDYVLQDFTLRGPAHTLDFRGKPNSVTDFNFNFYAVQDKGLPQPDGSVVKQGGSQFQLTAKTQIWGFTGRLDYNYLSSFLFRQSFSNSYNSALSSEVSSIGYLQRHFDGGNLTLNIVFQRDQLFEAATPLNQPKNDVVIQKLPYVNFSGRDQQLPGDFPVWFSFGSSAGLLRRQESDILSNGQYTNLDTGLIMPRVDMEPRVSTAFRFLGFSLIPSITFGLTDYGKNYSSNSTTEFTPASCGGYPACPPVASAYNVVVQSSNLLRKDADFTLELHVPAIERVFTPPKWLHMGEKVKHVIEVGATYEYVTGINQFQRIIHFDETDILSNTNQLTVDLTNRLYKKDKNGKVVEFLTWHVTQAHYFDPTFGGAVIAGQRNINLEAIELTPYTFLDGPRSYSPVVSSLTVNPYSFFSFDYRTAYDPFRHRFVDHAFTANFGYKKFGVHINDTAITTNTLLVPQANQISFGASYGTSVRRGWNLGGSVTYDLLLQRQLYEFIQGTYNTDCCGFSVQLRRFNFGFRDENQYLFSFSLANLGTFGSMQKQDRLF
jgi:LPS-assembly protein